MPEPVSDETARTRWMAINAVRLAGVAMVLVGLLIIQNVIPEPIWAGYVIGAVGLADVFLVPLLLVRRWRSPSE